MSQFIGKCGLAAAIAISIGASSLAEANVNVGGRIHLDAAFHDEDQRELSDGFRVRRARIGVNGKVDDNWSYKSEIDFAENGVDFKDMYIGHSSGIKIGQFKVPFGLDELTSSNDITFIERSLPTSFTQSRRIGFGYENSVDNFLFQSMIFGQPIGSQGSRQAAGGDENFGVAGRVVFNPQVGEGQTLHLGIGANMESPNHDNDETARFRARPESRVTGLRFVDTGTIADVDSIFRYNLEGLYINGPFTLQGEYLAASVNRDSGLQDYDFDGAYVQALYTMGGQRGYRGGRLRGPSVGDAGTWEFGIRYSTIDLNDSGLMGGKENNITLGINYYPTNRLRFMFNYINVDTDEAAGNDDPNIFLMRAQVSF